MTKTFKILRIILLVLVLKVGIQTVIARNHPGTCSAIGYMAHIDIDPDTLPNPCANCSFWRCAFWIC